MKLKLSPNLIHIKSKSSSVQLSSNPVQIKLFSISSIRIRAQIKFRSSFIQVLYKSKNQQAISTQSSSIQPTYIQLMEDREVEVGGCGHHQDVGEADEPVDEAILVHLGGSAQ